MPSVAAAMRALDDGRHRAEFYRMWRAGVSVAWAHPRSFEEMGPRQSPLTEDIRGYLLAGTGKGRGIADLVKAGGQRFEEFERALLTVGEESGRLEDTLRLLGDFYTTKHQLMLSVKNKMAYPLFTGLFASFIAPLPLLVVYGNIPAYFASAFGTALLLVASAGGIVAAVARRYGRKPPLARARMARALATAVSAGLTLPRAVRMAADASENPEIKAFVTRMSEKQLASRSVAESLQGCPHLTPDFLGYLRVAESTGDFSQLSRLAELYEDGFR